MVLNKSGSKLAKLTLTFTENGGIIDGKYRQLSARGRAVTVKDHQLTLTILAQSALFFVKHKPKIEKRYKRMLKFLQERFKARQTRTPIPEEIEESRRTTSAS